MLFLFASDSIDCLSGGKSGVESSDVVSVRSAEGFLNVAPTKCSLGGRMVADL
jgi:hypothetical protein